ncbi:hypothetical protein QBC38DRAFT_169535 [Podospora fimiseda]|uniref:Uncharacterized protein n=1 Tax=Podospora fimiseda TaxID=252190 RepID=A0AAN7BR49_9PEZI|nr:hypothetical protein QBC38DRAFT_169535 [Podospora fimiseda]
MGLVLGKTCFRSTGTQLSMSSTHVKQVSRHGHVGPTLFEGKVGTNMPNETVRWWLSWTPEQHAVQLMIRSFKSSRSWLLTISGPGDDGETKPSLAPGLFQFNRHRELSNLSRRNGFFFSVPDDEILYDDGTSSQFSPAPRKLPNKGQVVNFFFFFKITSFLVLEMGVQRQGGLATQEQMPRGVPKSFLFLILGLTENQCYTRKKPTRLSARRN